MPDTTVHQFVNGLAVTNLPHVLGKLCCVCTVDVDI
jgi:hypothetical protein